jgi:hypothetical protein
MAGVGVLTVAEFIGLEGVTVATSRPGVETAAGWVASSDCEPDTWASVTEFAFAVSARASAAEVAASEAAA